jgi:hypothetical protein
MSVWQEIKDYTVPTNATSVTLSGFDTITKDDFIKVVTTLVNASSSVNSIRLTANSSINTNYTLQYFHSSGTGTDVNRVNVSEYMFAMGNATSNAISYLKLSENNVVNYFTNHTGASNSGVRNDFHYVTSSGATFPSGITSLTFTSTQTNGIGTGSRIQIYKLAAKKVVDITTVANATQVDLSGFTINKNSEYLLVSYWDSQSGGGDLYLTPNDLTTNTNYYSQYIYGTSSSATAGRVNLPRVGSGGTNGTSNTYMYIKLSEIGAFTTQSYELYNTGTTSPQILNWFMSSTYENLTSITKLNIRSEGSNGLLAGSRFTLYELY